MGNSAFRTYTFFYILTVTVMAVVFDLLRAIAGLRFVIKNVISWRVFLFQNLDYEMVNGLSGS